MKILIADDNPADRTMLRFHLSQQELVQDIVEVGLGQDAVDILQGDHDISCLFLDYRMPDMDGTEVLKQIYDSTTKLAPCPTVMLTGQGSETIMIEALRYGAQDYLMKDNLSKNSIAIVMHKAKELYALRQAHNETEDKLSHAKKMDAVGRLTGGIAHDFNNLLTIIFGNTRLVDLILDQEEPNLEMLAQKIDAIKRASTRGADLVKRLMVFSRQRQLEAVTCDLNIILDDIKPLISSALGDSISLRIKDAQGIWPVDIDRNEFEHAVLNMCSNARDAMAGHDDGALSISIKQGCFGANDQDKPEYLGEGDYVRLSIRDNGSGIPKNQQKKIFDPFFTTKDLGTGTGLGLSMAYSFTRNSGGDITLESVEGEGTCFHLYFPRSKSTYCAKSHIDKEEAAKGNGERILIVEDDPQIKDLAVEMLQSYGYTTLEALNSDQAMELISGGQHIDILFTDIEMPGDMNGGELAAAALEILPDLKVLFTTGYTQESLPSDTVLNKDHPMLTKPYSHNHLLNTIEDILS